MSRPRLEVADIFRRWGETYRQKHRPPPSHQRVMRAIQRCRTAALGGHVERCTHCSYERISYNSCRNRHCPKCQNLARAEWVQRRKAELLPIQYFHIVFTIPQPMNALALQNKAVLYKLLFAASSQTLLQIAADPKHLGAKIGFFSVLHTWGQNLLHHPHVHCVATGGGLSPDGQRWISCRPGFFLSVRVLSRLFRRLFLEGLRAAFATGKLEFHGTLEPLQARFESWLEELAQQEWVVYAKPPFGGPAQVIEYLGRYTHRIAISNQRLLNIEGDTVTFQYKDYRAQGDSRSKQMIVEGEEFIRRFLLHILDPGFARIHYYGLFAGRNKKKLLTLCADLLETTPLCLPSAADIARYQVELLIPLFRCPRCGGGEMLRIATVAPEPVAGINSS